MTQVFDSLGWALLHSIWQGGLAFLAVILFRGLFKKGTPVLRYNFQILCLVACFAAFLVTFELYQSGGQSAPALKTMSAAQTFSQVAAVVMGPGNSIQVTPEALSLSAAASAPLLGILWCIGFAVMAARYVTAYLMTQKLRRAGLTDAPMFWQNRFRTMMLNTGVPENVRLYVSRYVSGPLTIGFIKPVVLVPVGFLMGLPQEQVEAILLHELAHIRRYDYLVNLIQTAIKTVLFFHPAIHYISSKIDIDREQACDDLAVAQSRNPHALARGLAALRLQSSGYGFAMAADGGDSPLVARLKRLAGSTEYQRGPEHSLMPLLATLLMGGIYFSATSTASAHPEPKTDLSRIEKDVERRVEMAEREAERAAIRFEENIERAERQREREQEQMERAQEQVERNAEQRERALDQVERNAEQRERAIEQAKRAAKMDARADKQHAKYTEMRETLYRFLIQDGYLSSPFETATMSFENDNWTANGSAISPSKEDKYCKLFAETGIKKSTITKIELTPDSTFIESESGSVTSKQSHGTTSKHTQRMTFGTHVHKDGTIHEPAMPVSPVPPVPPVPAFSPPGGYPQPTPLAPIHPIKADMSYAQPDFIWPAGSSNISAVYGQKGKLWEWSHQGLDIKADVGTAVYASADGIVELAAKQSKWGNRITLKHNGGYQTLYGHMNGFTISSGQSVKAGDVIGGIGSTGQSTGPHLHFEIRKDGQTLDPLPLIQ